MHFSLLLAPAAPEGKIAKFDGIPFSPKGGKKHFYSKTHRRTLRRAQTHRNRRAEAHRRRDANAQRRKTARRQQQGKAPTAFRRSRYSLAIARIVDRGVGLSAHSPLVNGV